MGTFIPFRDTDEAVHARAAFADTRWSLVLRAGAGSREALEDLGRAYWPAVYAFLRRKGFAPEAAEDVTQHTFLRLLQDGRLPAVDPAKGRFRSFVCACAEHEAAHFREHNRAAKRDAGRTTSLDTLDAERHYRSIPTKATVLEQVFDRAWSQIIVTRALKNLHSDYERLSKASICAILAPLLNGGTERGDFRTIAEKLGVTEGNARVIWNRFKGSFIDHLRREVAETVALPDEIDAELRHLVSAWLSGGP